MAIQSKNPATEEILKDFDELTNEELEIKLAKSQLAFKGWKETSFSVRAELMHKLAKYLRDNIDELVNYKIIEMGKTKKAGYAVVEKCALLCEYYANNAERILSDEKYESSGSDSYVKFDPLGPVLAIMPWNFPYWQVYRFAVPAIMAGNVGLLKHASNVPQCAQAIEDSFIKAGFPEGVFQNLFLSSGRVESVIRDDRVKAVTITGSEKAGSEVARVAGEEIKKTVLELGGSDPFIVFADADLDLAAEIAVKARLQNNVGQSCIAAKRFIVEESVADKFTEKVKNILEKLVVDDPTNDATDVGPLATESIRNEVENQVTVSINKGAKLICGGQKKSGAGYFYMPTLLTNVTKGMPVYDEEVFGPVMPIILFKTEVEAIKIANDTRYGLGSTIFTTDMNRAKRLISKIDAGNVFVNDSVKSNMRAPFGGIKKSGYGRELSDYGIKEFVNIKNVFIK